MVDTLLMVFIVKLHMLPKFADTATLKLDVLITPKLDVNPIVVDREETEDCVTERILNVLDKSVEYSLLTSTVLEAIVIRF